MKRDTRHYGEKTNDLVGTDQGNDVFFPGDFDALREKVDAFLCAVRCASLFMRNILT